MFIPKKRCCDCDHFPSVKIVRQTCQNSSLPRDPKQSEVAEAVVTVAAATIAMIEEIVDSKIVVAEEAGNVGQHLLLVETSTIMEATKTMAEVVNGHEEKLPHLNNNNSRIVEAEEVVEEEAVAVNTVRAHHFSTVLLRP